MRRRADRRRLLQPDAAAARARLLDHAADLRAERERDDGLHGDGAGVAGLDRSTSVRRCRSWRRFTGFVEIKIKRIGYSVTTNTLNIDLPEVILYLAPEGMTDTGRPERDEVRHDALDSGGDDGRG